jgi:hypothetical protein
MIMRKMYGPTRTEYGYWRINLLAPEFYIEILALSVCKM